MDIPDAELRQILSHYDVGALTTSEKLTRGYVNTSYAVTTKNGKEGRKYLLRVYRPGIQEQEIVYEHSIIRHLMDTRFDLAARVIPALNGATYLRLPADHKLFCALFEYLPGKDKYSWIRPNCRPGEIIESAATLAHFHTAVSGLTPDGFRAEPTIINLLPLIEQRVPERLAKRGASKFEEMLAENQAFVLGAIARVRQGIEPDEFNQTPHLVNHGDYHPGNLKFDRGRVVGLFDLDWSKVDARTFDLGLALTYFCASWDARNMDEYFRLDRAAVFLRAYQAALPGGENLRRLSEVELKHMPLMIPAGNIYVLEWALRDFYGGQVNPVEYLGYLNHHLYLMSWFEDPSNQDRLQRMLDESVIPA